MLSVSREGVVVDRIVDFPPEERFIKLPIQNFLKIEKIEPIRPQIALINAINDPSYRAVVAALSRRTGKTYISNLIAQLVSYMPGSNVLIIAPNYNLSQISWDLQRQMLKKHDIELVKSNAKDKIMELQNTSTIRMASISQVDSAVGRSYDYILFDEAALDDRGASAFNIQLLPTLDKVNSKVVFISTPRGKNWFYQFFKRGFSDEYPEWVSIHSDYKENPRVSPEVIEQARRSMSEAEFNQEFLADFVSMQGQIWKLPQSNIVSDYEIRAVDVVAGLDVGFRDATAFVVMLTDGYNIYIVDEYLANERTTKEHGLAIKALEEKYNIDFIYIDSQAQQTKYDLAMNFSISTINAKKSVLDGIGYVSSLIESGRVFVHPRCTNVLAMFDNYVWDTREGVREKPKHDEYSHMADALRYCIYTHSFNMEPL